MDGVVETRDDGSFWMIKTSGETIPFSMEAEGLKHLGLIWQLVMNESITKDSVILWDEPEASINPENIPVLVEIMLELQRHDVQIIAATHSYNFARYFDILKKDSDIVQYYSLYKSDNGFTKYTTADKFVELTPNSIDDAGEKLYNDVIRKSMEEL
jgi:predicted ATPase